MIYKLAYNVQEATKASGISRSTLYELMKSGELDYSQVRGRRLIPGTSLTQLIERHRVVA